MHNYELMIIFDTKLGEDDVAAYVEKFSNHLEFLNGKILSVNKWGKRRLAYPINKHTEGVYLVMILTMPSSKALEINNYLKSSEEIIRFMLLKTSK